MLDPPDQKIDEAQLVLGLDSSDDPTSRFEIHGLAAGFYAALLKHRYFDEATEFAEWYLDTFDHDLES